MSLLASVIGARRSLTARRLLTLVTVVLTSAACSTLPAATSTVVGCDADDIDISNAQSGPSGDTWTATCRGQVYDCAREEQRVEARGWNLTSLEYQRFRGTVTGDTYCIPRDRS
jgi:hypothetical protein